MKTLIVYASRHGCTADAARTLAEKLDGEVELADLAAGDPPAPSGFDRVLIGGSIRAGKVQREIRALCRRHAATLLEKRLGLFLCHMYEGETAIRQFETAFPAELRAHATARGLFGGVLDFDKLGFFERKIVEKVAGVSASVSKIDRDAIDAFAAALRGD